MNKPLTDANWSFSARNDFANCPTCLTSLSGWAAGRAARKALLYAGFSMGCPTCPTFLLKRGWIEKRPFLLVIFYQLVELANAAWKGDNNRKKVGQLGQLGHRLNLHIPASLQLIANSGLAPL